MNCRHQFRGCTGLQYVPVSSASKGLRNNLGVTIYRDIDNFGGGRDALDTFGSVHPIQKRHANVHQNDGGHEALGRPNQRSSVMNFGDYLKIGCENSF